MVGVRRGIVVPPTTTPWLGHDVLRRFDGKDLPDCAERTLAELLPKLVCGLGTPSREPLASEKLPFFHCSKKLSASLFFGFQVFYVRSLWKPKKKASRNPKKRLLEAKKRGF